MTIKILPKSALAAWIDHLREDHTVYGPKRNNDQYVFDEIRSAQEIELAYPTTILPPKKLLLPQHEELMRFDLDGPEKIQPIIPNHPRVILGVHTCDLHAIALTDCVYGEGYPDEHYGSRRKHTTLVSIECLTPCSAHAFCKSMGTTSVPEAFDLHMTDVGDRYVLEIGSEKGMSLLERFDKVRDATQEDLHRMHQVMSEKWPRFPYPLDFDASELPHLLSLSYDSLLWDELGERCLSCGSCNLVCPTCVCYDVIDEVEFNLHAGTRSRIWDSCQLDRFALVAGGHNFRVNRAARLRHRFFHKGKYQTETYGLVGCVGCGRCASACLANISPIEILNELYHRQVPYVSIEQEVMV
jgi:sulfhydrogenase subunit beta (sulfur reductase)